MPWASRARMAERSPARNVGSFRLLQSGFKNNPPVHYYQGGDTHRLPDELKGMITAELLGPSPKGSGGEFAASDNKTEQYIFALADNGVPHATRIKPFDTQRWPATVTLPRIPSTSSTPESPIGDRHPRAMA